MGIDFNLLKPNEEPSLLLNLAPFQLAGPHGDWKQEVEELDKVVILFYYEW